MKVIELFSLTESEIEQLKEILGELSLDIHVTSEMLYRAVESSGTHVFTLLDNDRRIIGTATLCISELPTGSSAHIEAVVVKNEFRGKHLGRMLMEYVIDYVRRKLPGSTVRLSSNPSRVVANELYKSLGFIIVETNVYVMKI